MDTKENPALAATSGPGSGKSCKLNPNTKRAALLRVFLERGESGLNCFEAVRLAHDYVLRSSVSDLQRQFGLTFCRHWEQVPGHQGNKVDCMRYWLAPETAQKARKLLGGSSTATATVALLERVL